MSDPTNAAAPDPTAGRKLELHALDDSNRDAVLRFVRGNEDRPRSAAFERWRYAECPAMEALVGMAGDECVATMFSMRRRWMTPDGPRELAEPFEWHANEAWRAQAPGFRIVRQRMREPRPMIAIAGTDMAGDLLVKLKWTRVATAMKFALPITGAYLATRGRGGAVAKVFDVIGTPLFRPRRRRGALEIETAVNYAPAVHALAAQQRRFTLMRLPDAEQEAWLRRAPAVVGQYVAFHAKADGVLVGWGLGRVFPRGPIRVGELLELYLVDAHRHRYAELAREMSVVLAGYGVDALVATTTCDDTMSALRALRFRPDDLRPVLAWWGGASVPEGPVLIDGAIGDHAFFPVPTDAEARWLEGRAP